MNFHDIEAFLFDMDGTLVDTEPCGLTTLEIIVKRFSFDLTQADRELFDKVWRRVDTNMNFDEYVKRLCSNNSYSNPEEVESEFLKEYKNQIAEADELPGATDLLEFLKLKNIPTAIVSASYKDQIETILKNHNWQDLFTKIVTFKTDYKNKKPDPEGYLAGASKLKVDIKNCLVVEDATSGIESGKNAGAKVIAVKAGTQVAKQDLSKADFELSSLSDLLMQLQNKNA